MAAHMVGRPRVQYLAEGWLRVGGSNVSFQKLRLKKEACAGFPSNGMA